MLNKNNTYKTVKKPCYAPTLWGTFLCLTLTWLSACNDSPTSLTETPAGPTTTPPPQEEDTNPNTNPASDPSPPPVALTKELIDALELSQAFNKNKHMQKELAILQKALKDIEAGKKDINMLISFYKFGDVTLQKRHVLEEALLMFESDNKLLQALINQGADVNHAHWSHTHGLETLLTRVVRKCTYQAIKWLLEKGADVPTADAAKRSLLSNISWNSKLSKGEKEELSQILIKKGAKKQSTGINWWISPREKGTTNDPKQG